MDEIPIIQRLYQFQLELHACVLSFPKVDKHTLGQHLQAKSLQLIETIFLASRMTAGSKKDILLQANSQLDLLKLLVRMASDCKTINQKKYMLLEGFLQESGKMLGGWLRSLV
ncbi:MAG TPA: four helix bundle protein [Candidatus Saccharimonadales bacterium]|nr:four helix bundle protein [Candidatus Saccharimonadales bacterium]